MSSELRCKKHNIDLECVGGRSAHLSNWYCPICDKEEAITMHVDDIRKAMESLFKSVGYTKEPRIMQGMGNKVASYVEHTEQKLTDVRLTINIGEVESTNCLERIYKPTVSRNLHLTAHPLDISAVKTGWEEELHRMLDSEIASIKADLRRAKL